MSLSLEQIVKEVYGKAPYEQALIAKDCGMKPDADGLIEFHQPVGYQNYDGVEEPVMGIISVEDAAEATDEDYQKYLDALQAEPAVTAQGGITTASTWEPYLWGLNGNMQQRFPVIGGTNPTPPFQGVAIDAVRLQAHDGFNPYQGTTTYRTQPYDCGTAECMRTSPLRYSARNYRRTYSFTGTVWGLWASVWWS